MNVFVVEYGNADGDESLDSIWATLEDAASYCETAAQEMFDDNEDYVESGYTYERTYGELGVRVTIFNDLGDEIEWWKTKAELVR